MKNLFTLSALAVLVSASLGAQAQFTVDGTLAPAEVGTGVGKYQLLGTYTGTTTHSVADRGLKALYMGTTATTLNIMVVASPEQSGAGSQYSNLVLYLDAPNRTGTAAGVRLAGGDNTGSPLRHRPTLDMPVDYGFRITVSPLNDGNNAMYLSKVDYTAPIVPPATRNPDTGLGTAAKNGTIATDVANPGYRTAFNTSATGSVAANTTTGWEFEIPLTAIGGAANNDVFRVIVAYVADNTTFYSDVLPQIAGQTTALGADPNFSTIAGSQNYAYQVGTGVLANRTASAAALKAAAYPNPVAATSRLDYTVPGTAAPVSVNVYNSLGRKALTLLSATQAGGAHTVELAPLQKL
ncbi:MAG: hypothetical protein H7Z21_09685, partial [Hymenobacter sp.]|nr:hypothetical protein [Hymenobacter sp.]